MGVGRWAIGAWPGLPQLWRRGDWSGLALALGFALLLNLVLLTTFVWTELVTPSVAVAAWVVVAGFWLASFISSWRSGFEQGRAPTAQEDLFPTAVAEYLKGNWYDVEQICQRLLRRNDRDVDCAVAVGDDLSPHRAVRRSTATARAISYVRGRRQMGVGNP